MVVRSEGDADRAFQALSDPTRRSILRLTSGRRMSVSEVAQHFPMSFAAVQRHVAVLEQAGLVTKTRRGREQLVQANLPGLVPVRDELDRLTQVWTDRITAMGELLAHETQESSP